MVNQVIFAILLLFSVNYVLERLQNKKEVAFSNGEGYENPARYAQYTKCHSERSVVHAESNAKREAQPRNLGFVQNDKCYPAAIYPFSCVAGKRYFERYSCFFRATHEKGWFVLWLNSQLLQRPKSCPYGHCCAVRLRGYATPLRMTH